MEENQMLEAVETAAEGHVASAPKAPRYEITISSKKNQSVLTVMIDRVPLLMVPGSVAISIGDKAAMYRKYLDKTLFNPDNKQQLLNYMVHLHDKGIEMGGMNLVCGCKFRFHAVVLRQFIIDNMDTFTSLISYLVPNSTNKSMLASEAGSSAMPTMSKGTLAPDDMAQIQELIRLDQEQQAANQANEAELTAFAEANEGSVCPDPKLIDGNLINETRREDFIPEVEQQ